MDLQNTYKKLYKEIENKMNHFEKIWENDLDIFTEMIFCLCTPQTKAQSGWKATYELKNSGILFDGNEDQIAEILSNNGVRFKNKKARYIIEARLRFMPREGFSLKSFISSMLDKQGQIETRNWFANKVKGYGLKEASHFLRNIGQGDDLCILDRHILRELDAYGVVPYPKKFNADDYKHIEKEMKKYAKELNIPVFALDFVFWAETHNNEIFK